MSIHKYSWKWRKKPAPGQKTVCVSRYGAFGDSLQAAAICAGFKRQGYWVVFNGSDPQWRVVEHDPNIDDFIVQHALQIPMGALGDYYCWLRSKHDRFVNLVESVEKTLLANEKTVEFEWAPLARHQHMNHNYLERQALIARVPYVPSDQRFYPTEEEMDWAMRIRKNFAPPGTRLILWVLSGSGAVHKLYPWQDDIIEKLPAVSPGIRIILIGHPDNRELEVGLCGKQVMGTCGKWTIRQALTMACASDLVVGPETGTMIAVSMLPIPKIVFLSHSTRENLTRDWVNTASLSAPVMECGGRGNNEAPACHQMHIGFDAACRRNEKFGVAECMVRIDPKIVWARIQQAVMTGKVDP